MSITCKNRFLCERVRQLQKNKPEISIIIPVYNVEKYLARCLDSVLRQSFNDFEVILLNDGSSDGSEAICREYAARDGRIRFFSQSNQGLSMARNNAMQQVRGRYIYFLDSDDSIHAQLLQLAYTLAEREQADMVCFHYKKCREGDAAARDDAPLVLEQLAYKVLAGSEVCFWGLHRRRQNIHYSVCSKLHKRELLAGLQFIPQIRYEDVPFAYAVLARHPKTVLLQAELYYYTLSPNSLYRSAGDVQHILDYAVGVNYIYNIYKERGREREMAFLKQDFIPNILRQQLARCHRALGSKKPAMFRAFAAELADLRSKDLVLWHNWMNVVFLTYFGLMYAWYCRIKRG